MARRAAEITVRPWLTVPADRGGTHTKWLIEHPENLGMTTNGDPGSIWQLPEFLALAKQADATTCARFQCRFQAQSSKPTRLLSTMKLALSHDMPC